MGVFAGAGSEVPETGGMESTSVNPARAASGEVPKVGGVDTDGGRAPMARVVEGASLEVGGGTVGAGSESEALAGGKALVGDYGTRPSAIETQMWSVERHCEPLSEPMIYGSVAAEKDVALEGEEP